MQNTSILVAPILSKVDHRIIVPSHFLTVLNEQGECMLPGKEFCEHYKSAQQDVHVDQSIMTVLRGRCDLSPKLVWDFGANIGYYTLFMRALGCQVVAIEPQPSMNDIHKRSLVANGWNNDGLVTLIEKAVSDVPGNITLHKLWQPGIKDVGKMTIDTVTIAELAHMFSGEEVELLKLDIDGPEILSLRGIADLADTLVIKNIIVELTVGAWNSLFGFKDSQVVDLFHKFFNVGYRMLLVYEDEFPKYPKSVMKKLKEVRDLGELQRAFEVLREPRSLIIEVLLMANRVTKNIFMTKDPIIIANLDMKATEAEINS
jgi:FkbM family methyltransferase